MFSYASRHIKQPCSHLFYVQAGQNKAKKASFTLGACYELFISRTFKLLEDRELAAGIAGASSQVEGEALVVDVQNAQAETTSFGAWSAVGFNRSDQRSHYHCIVDICRHVRKTGCKIMPSSAGNGRRFAFFG